MRKLSIFALCVCVAFAAAFGLYRGYGVWKQSHLVSQARGFMAKGDMQNASLCVRQALVLNPRNIEITRLAADLSQAARSPEALIWRHRVVELNPSSTDDRLALAQAALMGRDFGVASNALNGVSSQGKATASFHNLAGALAVAQNDYPLAKIHFTEASRLDPRDLVPQLDLAVVDIHGSNQTAIAQARVTLHQLSVNPTNAEMRCEALRELVTDEIRTQHATTAMGYADQLLQEQSSTFSDQLLRLDILGISRNPGFRPAVDACQRQVGTNTLQISQLATWEQAHGEIRPCQTWLQNLPQVIRTNQPVARLLAESYMSLSDWPSLTRSLSAQNWNQTEFLRHAIIARAEREQSLMDSAALQWGQAVKGAIGSKMSQIMLLRLAQEWRWRSEAEELLWTIVNKYPDERWAADTLTADLFISGRTKALLALFSQQAKSAPADLKTKNNLAMIALLLNAKEQKPNELAREVYEKSPMTASFASTYAYSLLLQNKKAEALSVMEKLPPHDLEDSSVSGYYGIILQANGDRAKAKRYLDLASKGTHLPEEELIFRHASSKA